jgi:hypothetical protein
MVVVWFTSRKIEPPLSRDRITTLLADARGPSRFRRRAPGTKGPNNTLAHTHTGTHQGGKTGRLRHVTPAPAARAVDAVLIHRTDRSPAGHLDVDPLHGSGTWQVNHCAEFPP